MNNVDKTILEQIHSTSKNYLRAKEVAQYLGIGLSTVWHYAKQGKLNPINISKRVTVFEYSDIEAFVNASLDNGGAK